MFHSGQGRSFIHLPTGFRAALGSIQPPIELVQGAIYPVVNSQTAKLTLRTCIAILHSPIRLKFTFLKDTPPPQFNKLVLIALNEEHLACYLARSAEGAYFKFSQVQEFKRLSAFFSSGTKTVRFWGAVWHVDNSGTSKHRLTAATETVNTRTDRS
jgi:hypothetical protein